MYGARMQRKDVKPAWSNASRQLGMSGVIWQQLLEEVMRLVEPGDVTSSRGQDLKFGREWFT